MRLVQKMQRKSLIIDLGWWVGLLLNRHILVVGTYRSNEVNHPLMSTIKALEDQDTTITQLGCSALLLQLISISIALNLCSSHSSDELN